MTIAQQIARRNSRTEAFAMMLAGDVKPYRALSSIYAGVTEYDPYLVDWLRVFTPIEYDAWDTIRNHCLPFFPQYPSHGVIFDFADPDKRIAIECDGKQWHDKQRDGARDRKMAALGWTTYRVSGSECRRTVDKAELDEMLRDEAITRQEHAEQLHHWMSNTSEGVITSIAVTHYGAALDIDAALARRVLDTHKGEE